MKKTRHATLLDPAKHPMSRRALIVAAVVALGGVYFIWHSLAATPSSADVNGDGIVNVSDLSIVLTNFGKSNASADTNSDGTVNLTDLSVLLTQFGTTIVKPTPPSPPPDPPPTPTPPTPPPPAPTPTPPPPAPTPTPPPTPPPPTPPPSNTLPGGQYYIKTNGNSCLDIDKRSGPVGNGTKIQIWVCNGAAGQIWVVRTAGFYKGWQYYELYNPESNRCMDVDQQHGPVHDGTLVRLWDCNGTVAQAFAGYNDAKFVLGYKDRILNYGTTAYGYALRVETFTDGTPVAVNLNNWTIFTFTNK